MKLFFSLLIVSLMLISCSMNYSLRKSFIGKETVSLEKYFGKPTTVIPREKDSLLVFEKKEDLKGTEISQGRMTLDPILSPKVTKIERYLFTIKSGKIADTRYERIYER